MITLGTLASGAQGQGVPGYEPINPVTTSRSPLVFLPFEPPRSGWHGELGLDYASTIESQHDRDAAELLDSEQLRLDLRITRPLGRRGFLLADVPVRGSYAGFLDGFLNWYHGLFGFRMPERDNRPDNVFAYGIALPDGRVIHRSAASIFLGDVRLGMGFRPSGALQSAVAITLPTATGPRGYGKRTVSAAVLNTARVQLADRLVLESTFGVGFTPRQGDLRAYQRTWFVSGGSGLRWRFWGRQSLYSTLYLGSPSYRGTTLPALDGAELSLDFGWILSTRSGREWRVGMTEDLRPGGPAVDLVFRLGVQ